MAKRHENHFADVSPSALEGFGKKESLLVRLVTFIDDVWRLVTRQARNPVIPNHRRAVPREGAIFREGQVI